MSPSSMTWEATQAEATRRGHEILLPEDRELFLDLDTYRALRSFRRRLNTLRACFADLIGEAVFYQSPGNNGGYHAIVRTTDAVSPRERIEWQLALGSDPLHEMLSLAALAADHPHPTVLFETPLAMDLVARWRRTSSDSLEPRPIFNAHPTH